MSSTNTSTHVGRPKQSMNRRLIHTGIRLCTKDRNALRVQARAEGISVSEYLRRIVWAHFAAKTA